MGFNQTFNQPLPSAIPYNGGTLQGALSTLESSVSSLDTTDVSEGSNLYYTEARVNNNTNVLANTAARHSAVSLGTANGLSLIGQQLSLDSATTTSSGAMSATDKVRIDYLGTSAKRLTNFGSDYTVNLNTTARTIIPFRGSTFGTSDFSFSTANSIICNFTGNILVFCEMTCRSTSNDCGVYIHLVRVNPGGTTLNTEATGYIAISNAAVGRFDSATMIHTTSVVSGTLFRFESIRGGTSANPINLQFSPEFSIIRL